MGSPESAILANLVREHVAEKALSSPANPRKWWFRSRGGGGTPYNGHKGEPERGTVFRLQVYKRVGISQVDLYKRERNRSFRYLKGPLIIIFRIDAPCGCFSLFIKHNMKMRTRLPKVGM